MTDPISAERLAEIREAQEVEAGLRAEVGRLTAELAKAQAEVDRLWYFVDTNDRLHDVITGAPDHYIINGDHSGCTCDTDWTPPPVQVEWGVEWGTRRSVYPYDDERSARTAAAGHESHVAVRRLVGPWTAAEPTQQGHDGAQAPPGPATGHADAPGYPSEGNTPEGPQDGSTDLRTPQAWCDRYGLEVVDPDGWRGDDAPPWETPITLPDFWRRYGRSTARNIHIAEYERIVADAQASGRDGAN